MELSWIQPLLDLLGRIFNSDSARNQLRLDYQVFFALHNAGVPITDIEYDGGRIKFKVANTEKQLLLPDVDEVVPTQNVSPLSLPLGDYDRSKGNYILVEKNKNIVDPLETVDNGGNP